MPCVYEIIICNTSGCDKKTPCYIPKLPHTHPAFNGCCNLNHNKHLDDGANACSSCLSDIKIDEKERDEYLKEIKYYEQ
jgi:hypothetical protein